MGRAEIRKAAKQQKHIDHVRSAEAQRQFANDCVRNGGMYDATRCLTDPYYLKAAQMDAIEKTAAAADAGIGKQILKQQFDQGYSAAKLDYEKHYEKLLSEQIMFARKNIFAATAIAMREGKVGVKRIGEVLARAQEIMLDELTTDGLLERCEQMTGISIEDDMLTY